MKWFLILALLSILALVFYIFMSNLEVKEAKKPKVNTETKEQTNIFDKNKIQYVKIAGKIIKVDLALTPEAQAQGLSGRKNMKENEGMLFVFDYRDKYAFWMKDMNFPLDIIWLSDNLEIVYIKKDASPKSYPESFSPTKDSKYVLEVNSGFSEKNNLKEREKVEFLSS